LAREQARTELHRRADVAHDLDDLPVLARSRVLPRILGDAMNDVREEVEPRDVQRADISHTAKLTGSPVRVKGAAERNVANCVAVGCALAHAGCTMDAMPKQIRFNAFDMNCVAHQSS